MNLDLDEIAHDFWKIPKKLVDSRVSQVYAPNFYYRTRSVQLLDRLQSKPLSLLEPIAAYPGYGLVVLTFYSYLSVTMILTMRFQLLLSSINQVKAVTV